MTVPSQARLPQLRGGLLWVYRTAWAVLAAAAVVVMAIAPFNTTMPPLIAGLRLVKGITLVAVAAILLRRRQRDPVAALLALALLCWTITSSFDFASTPIFPLLLDRLRFLLFASALLLFPDGAWTPGWTRKVALASILVFAAGVVETLGLVPTRLFLPLAIGCIVAAVASLVQRFRLTELESLRQQLRWVALGLVSGIGLILTARAGKAVAATPMDMQLSILWEAMFQLGIVAIALGFLVSLLRYRLYDAEAAISRSATYAILTLGVLTCFAATEGFIEGLGQRYLGSGISDFSAVFAASAAALLFTPLHHRIDSWAERKFQRDLILLKDDLPPLVAALSTTRSPGQIGKTILVQVEEALHLTRLALIFNGTVVAASGIEAGTVRHWLARRDDASAMLSRPESGGSLFPLQLASTCPALTGTVLLLVGPRPDSTIIGKDEIKALETLLPSLRQALATASARESYERKFRRTLEGSRDEITRLAQRMETMEMVQKSLAHGCG